jgi:hypothetical protein
MATTTPAAKPPQPAAEKPGLAKALVRRGVIAIALVLLLLVPAFALMGATGQPAATYSAMGTIAGLVAVMGGGLRIGTITAVVIALLAPLVVIAGLTPITGAAIMAIMTLVIGRLSTFGLHRATMLVPILLAWPMLAPVPWLPHDRIDELNALLAKHGTSLADALTAMQAKQGSPPGNGSSSGDAMSHLMQELRMDSTYLTWLILFFFIGAIIPVVIGWFMRHRLPAPKLVEHPRRETVPYTVTITVLAAAATYYFLNNPKLPGGAFFIAVILVLAQVGNDIAWRLTIQRVLGTFAGVVLFIGINQLVGTTTFTEVFGLPFPLGIYLIGILFGVVAVMAKFSPRHWIYYIFIVPTTAYLNAFTVEGAADLGKARLIDNLVGAVLVILAALITLAASRLYERRYPTDPNAPIAASPA